jgi:hypothetical protein
MSKKDEAVVEEDTSKEAPESNERLTERLENNPRPMESTLRRKRIEESLTDFDIESFLFNNYLEQDVPLLVPVGFRTPLTKHTLWLEKMVGELVGDPVMYVNHLGRLMNLSATLSKMGTKSLPDLWEYRGDFDKDYEGYAKAIRDRIKLLMDLPIQFTDDLMLNLEWFEHRVQVAIAKVGVLDLKNS